MQNKMSKLEAIAAKLGLKVNRNKSKIIRINEENSEGIKLETGELEDVAEFTYLVADAHVPDFSFNDI
ncbi:Hypothetical predicted protein [Octopus vulgaris]|uniref:Uncharacterized protein n=1 Tax=Octopus vulgaris TaxID=6645 RepID=A0AA36BRQ3_OCTVU|nr:Hypothetical predicted protein [Octopus vulgaris]